MTTEIEFWLLGPLVVRRGGVVVAMPRGHQRAVLATLLLAANQVVTIDELAEVLWGEEPPASARLTVQNYVKRLRAGLGPLGRERIGTRPGGYLISVNAGELDVPRFEELVASARKAARDGLWDRASADAAAALTLWRGEPLADSGSRLLASREAPRLAEMRLQALEARLEADLRLGDHAGVLPDLQRLTRAHPLRERLHALLMLALYRCGRQGEALAAYQHARGVLVEELGIEPGIELQRIHQEILTADCVAAASAEAASARRNVGITVPRQLPGTVPSFTGRAAELAVLTELLDQVGSRAAGTVVVSAISGTAGVGKTALAVHWAHQVAARFPDGQLYVNLRGFDPSGTLVTTAEAIRMFLDALGVPADRIPRDPPAQAGLYRSLLADRHLLIVLDNAHDEQQVRPLLPGTPGCHVVVTSRNQLAGLAATTGASLLTLDVFPAADARAMLAARLGIRAAAEHEAVAEITELCARLPLALAIAAARAAAFPRPPLSVVAAELRTVTSRLVSLDTGDPAASVQAVFSWSVLQLSPAAARMFRLLGLHPGPDITAPAAASLAAVGHLPAKQAIGELTRAHLLAEHSPGRFSFHDLLRAYAAEQAHASDSDIDRRSAVARLLDHYLHTAFRAALLLDQYRDPIALAPPLAGVLPEQLDDSKDALAWFTAELNVLLGSVSLAADMGFGECAWQLPWTMKDYLDRGRGHDWAGIQRIALDAAARLGDVAGLAATRLLAAAASCRLGDIDTARGHLTTAVALFRQLGDRNGQARAHLGLSFVCDAEQRYEESLWHDEQALSLSQAIGYRLGQADALNSMGMTQILLGQPRRGRSCCRRALVLHRQLGTQVREAHTWDSLGSAEQQLGRHEEAVACYERAVSLFRELGYRYQQAGTLTSLGDACHEVNDRQGAQQAWQQALVILDDLQHPDAERVRAQLGRSG